MPASLNKTFLAGNMTRDPELRFTQDGVPVCNFGIAVNRVRSKDRDACDYFNVVAWRELGETIANYKKKGDPILVEGRLQYSSWETDDGTKRNRVDVVADNVQFLGSANGNGRGFGSGSSARAAAGSSGDAGMDDEDYSDIPF